GEVAVVQGGGESLTGQGVLGAYDRGFPSAAGRLLVWCGRAAWATGTGCSIGWGIDSRIRDRLGSRSDDRVGTPGHTPGSTNRIGIRRAGTGGLGGRRAGTGGLGGRGVGRGGTWARCRAFGLMILHRYGPPFRYPMHPSRMTSLRTTVDTTTHQWNTRSKAVDKS